MHGWGSYQRGFVRKGTFIAILIILNAAPSASVPSVGMTSLHLAAREPNSKKTLANRALPADSGLRDRSNLPHREQAFSAY